MKFAAGIVVTLLLIGSVFFGGLLVSGNMERMVRGEEPQIENYESIEKEIDIGKMIEDDYTLTIREDRVEHGWTTEEYENEVDPDRWGTTDPEPGKYKFTDGSEITIKAEPNQGWMFSHWTGDFSDGEKEKKEITVEMNSDKEITANFRVLGEDEYIWTDREWYEPREKVAVEVKNDGSALHRPILSDFGIYIEHLETEKVVFGPIKVDEELPEIPDYGHTESFTWNQTDLDGEQVPEGNYRVKAESRFNHTTDFIISEDPTMLDLSISVEGQGKVEVEPDKDKYEYGTDVELKAIPEEGWEFDGWIGSASGTYPTINVTMDEDKNITAHFEELKPAEFEFSALTVEPEEPEVGEEIKISIDVTNVGELEGEYTVEFYVNHALIDGVDVELEAGETKTVSTTYEIEEAGEYHIEAEDVSITFTVEEEEEVTTDGWLIAALILSVIALLVLVWVGVQSDGKTSDKNTPEKDNEEEENDEED